MEWMYPKIGQRIRETRTKKQISQQDLAKEIGLTRTSIVNIEQGRQKIMIHSLYAVAKVLDVPVATLLPKSDDSNEQVLSDPLAQEDPAVQEFFQEIIKKL